MAESKGALIAKSVQKHAGRAKEKLLQNLGKVDRTLDDIFEEHLQNFNRQQQQAARLQKEFNNYIRCIRAVQTASKSLMEAITEVYESSWSGHDLLYVQAQNMEMLWQDFSHKLGDQVLIPLNTYVNQFPETRKKIEKRGRKLVDYDSQRHNYQSLQASSAKRRDDVKITRGREQLEEARRTYEALNSELHDELPALHDSRVLFYLNNLQTLFQAERLFHHETTKVFSELEAITDKLANESQRGTYRKPLGAAPAALTAPTAALTAAPALTAATALDKPAALPHNGNTMQTPPRVNGTNGHHRRDSSADSNDDDKPEPPAKIKVTDDKLTDVKVTDVKVEEIKGNGDAKVEKDVVPAGNTEHTDKPETNTDTVTTPVLNNNEEKTETPIVEDKETSEKKTEEVYDIPVGATLAGLPAGVLYRVRATYRYVREDSDELSFDVGDVIRVVEYDDPEEQEEGWLMGIKEGTNEKGMFPANFTRPI